MSLQQALIRSQDCIGCTKCIDACPTDAIIGAQKFLHSVIEKDCIGCERCVPVCPVDCIELVPMADRYNPETLAAPAKEVRIAYIRELAQVHKRRLQHEQAQAQSSFEASKSASALRKAYLQQLFKKNNS